MADGKLFHAEVYVSLKRLVNDPEGIEIRNGLHNLGYDEVEDVRSGKYFQLKLRASSRDEAIARVNEMAERLLSNTVIEEFHVQVRDSADVS
ncbi:MAG TPA: phosphoribosylformylglycinamidine synthase subunit PurS [Thermomicrobiales bacterium]|nr:phosphoribosylformylglycinamidine synthase subunit PurS [Thermomicrobiales bacterium]